VIETETQEKKKKKKKSHQMCSLCETRCGNHLQRHVGRCHLPWFFEFKGCCGECGVSYYSVLKEEHADHFSLESWAELAVDYLNYLTRIHKLETNAQLLQVVVEAKLSTSSGRQMMTEREIQGYQAINCVLYPHEDSTQMIDLAGIAA
jgi:hypothetical protein